MIYVFENMTLAAAAVRRIDSRGQAWECGEAPGDARSGEVTVAAGAGWGLWRWGVGGQWSDSGVDCNRMTGEPERVEDLCSARGR